MEERILDLLKDITEHENIQKDTELIENSILDSLSLVVLIEELEQEFAISILGDEINLSDFKNVYAIANFVQTKEK